MDGTIFWVIRAEDKEDLFACDIVWCDELPDEETCRGFLEYEYGGKLGHFDIVVYGPYQQMEAKRFITK